MISMRFSFLFSILLFLAAPAVASAEAARTFQELAVDIVDIFDATTAVLIVLGIVVYFYGVSTNILNFSDDGGEKVRAYFFWGIIILFVMVSIWGILGLLKNTLFGESSNAPTTSTGLTPSNSFESLRFTGE